MLKALVVRLYPTPEQARFLRGQFGAVRFVWNKGLSIKRHYYRVKGKYLDPVHDLKKLIAVAKRHRKYAWLKAYDVMALQESLRHLGTAFSRFSKKEAGYPRFKRRRGEQSSYHCTGVSVGSDFVKIPKMQRIKAVIHRPVEGKVKSITLKLDSCGDFFASILYDDGKPCAEKPKTVRASEVTGFDLGLTAFVTDSNGNTMDSPKAYRRAQKRLVKSQRALSRKQKGSANREKARRRLAKHHRRVARIRADFLHKASRKLVNENQVLVFETLKIKNMLGNHHLARAIADAGWGEFIRMIEYKAERQGRCVARIDTYYPSSKTCSHCGYKRESLELSVRSWTCPKCGAHHDRDVNAALNIKAEGIRMLRANGLVVLRA